MKIHIGKGTDEFRFFADLYKFVGDFYLAETSEEYWDQLITASDELLEKYKNYIE